MRRGVLVLMIAVLLGLLLTGAPAHARTCRRITVTIMDDPFFAHPICVEVTLPAGVPLGDVDVHTPDGIPLPPTP